jgi:hypothetical protein
LTAPAFSRLVCPHFKETMMADPVSRDLIRAILETRDRRHNETHAAMVSLWQELVRELVEGGIVAPLSLANRIDSASQHVADDHQGEAARHLLAHIAEWTRSAAPPDKPVLEAKRWYAPGYPPPEHADDAE